MAAEREQEEGDGGAGPSRREQAKEERRERILAAAESLIRQRGDTDFSMRDLAESAEVAFATPFNLFESKDRLLATLLSRRIWPRQRSLAAFAPHLDPIDHVFDFASGALGTYTDDPGLFRPLLRSVMSPDVHPVGSSLDAAADFWAQCLGPARRAGLVRDIVDGPGIDRAFHITFRGVLVGWARAEIDTDCAEIDLLQAVGLLLAGSVTDDGRKRVDDRISAVAPADAAVARSRPLRH